MTIPQHTYTASEQITKTAARIKHITFHYPADQLTVAWEVGDGSDPENFVVHESGSKTLTLSDFASVKADADAMATKALAYLVTNGDLPAGTPEDV
jgi:hypothetical protein